MYLFLPILDEDGAVFVVDDQGELLSLAPAELADNGRRERDRVAAATARLGERADVFLPRFPPAGHVSSIPCS